MEVKYDTLISGETIDVIVHHPSYTSSNALEFYQIKILTV